MTERLSGREGEPQIPIADVCEQLQASLGQRLTAYAINERDPRSIGRFARGESMPPETESRLRTLHEIFGTLEGAEADETIRAWLIGSEPLLDDEAPAELLHRGEFEPVKNAAKTFAVAG